mmetsp:Transcript_7537/g.21624  ORF Transcript_7537/g.21624 Transcript_7537/m.21624 type:complete len:219 (-) Transcript_7537:115-771(-)
MTSRTVCLALVLLGLRFAFRFSGGGGGIAVAVLLPIVPIVWDTGAPNSSLICRPGVDGIGEILLPRVEPLKAAAARTAIMLAVDVLILLGLTRWPAAKGGGGGTMPPNDWPWALFDAVDARDPRLGLSAPCILLLRGRGTPTGFGTPGGDALLWDPSAGLPGDSLSLESPASLRIARSSNGSVAFRVLSQYPPSSFLSSQSPQGNLAPTPVLLLITTT